MGARIFHDAARGFGRSNFRPASPDTSAEPNVGRVAEEKWHWLHYRARLMPHHYRATWARLFWGECDSASAVPCEQSECVSRRKSNGLLWRSYRHWCAAFPGEIQHRELRHTFDHWLRTCGTQNARSH